MPAIVLLELIGKDRHAHVRGHDFGNVNELPAELAQRRLGIVGDTVRCLPFRGRFSDRKLGQRLDEAIRVLRAAQGFDAHHDPPQATEVTGGVLVGKGAPEL